MKKDFKEVKLPLNRNPQKEIPRSLRLPNFIDIQVDANKVLACFSLAIIGLGSIGCNVAQKFARLKIGRLYLVDFGHFKPASLLTHPIAAEEAVAGKSKAKSAARFCKKLSPSTRCFYFNGPVQDLDMSSFAGVDFVVLCTDNLAAEVDVTKRCVHLSKPLIHCAVNGDTLIAQVRLFANNDINSPCICCSYNATEKEFLNANTVFSCNGAVEGRNMVQKTNLPTMSTAFLCSLAADLGLMLIVRYALKLGAPLTDSLVEYCGYTNRMVTTPLYKSSSCICDHSPWKIRKLSRPLINNTLRELSLASELSENGSFNEYSFTVSDMSFVELGICSCSTLQPVRRFVKSGHIAGICGKCGADLFPHPFFSNRPVSGTLIQDVLDKPLKKVGAKEAVSVLVSRNGKGVLFFNSAIS